MRHVVRLTVMSSLLVVAGLAFAGEAEQQKKQADGKTEWITLFNGKDLTGWQVSEENPRTFKVEEGAIVAHGPRAHLFYVGDPDNKQDHIFKNFELVAEVMTFPRANSGIYFHTEYQKKGWPSKGFEAQVNNTQGDWRRTGSLYAIKDSREKPADDNEWFTYTIRVEGKHIVIKINDKVITDYTQPGDEAPNEKMPGRVIDEGTFALQGHDPGSKVLFRNIKVRRLPEAGESE